jgi:hypothetical protein
MVTPVAPWHHDRAYRNRNPGNLRPRGNAPPWPGQAGVETGTDGHYAIFPTPADGWAALAIWCLDARYVRGLKTACAMITSFAPPGDDNPTSAYAEYVTGCVGEGELDLTNQALLLTLVRSIAHWEDNKVQWTEVEIQSGMMLAQARWPAFMSERIEQIDITSTADPPEETADELNAGELDKLKDGSETA